MAKQSSSPKPPKNSLHPFGMEPEQLSYISEWATLNMSAITAGQVLGAETYTRMINVESTNIVIASSTAETEIYNYTLGGGTLGTQGGVRLLIGGAYYNASGSTSTIELKFSYGATLMYEDATAPLASHTNFGFYIFDFTLVADGATNAQGFIGTVMISDRSATVTTGTGSLDTPSSVFVIAGTATEDSTLNKAITVKVQHSNNSAATIFSRGYAMLTKIGH